MLGELSGFSFATLVLQDLPLRKRPNKKLELLPVREGALVKSVTPCDVIYDLGINTVGFLYIEAECEKEEKILISYIKIVFLKLTHFKGNVSAPVIE